MKSVFEGVCVALATPFDLRGRIDYISLEKLLNHCINGKVSAVAVLATTGEGVAIKEKERAIIIKFVKKLLPSNVKLIVGTGNNNMDKAIENTKQAKSLGADAVLAVTPYYNKTTSNGVVEYYRQLNKIGVPIIAYNVPSRTGLNIDLNTLKILINQKLICGIKESTADITRIIDLMQICKNKIAVYSGEDDLNYLFYAMGASGAVSVTANIFPKEVSNIYNLTQAQKYKKACREQARLHKFNKLVFCETNPIPIKYCLAQTIITSDYVRPPLVCLTNKNKIKISRELKRLLNK